MQLYAYAFAAKLQNYLEYSLEEEQGENVGSGPLIFL